MIARSQRTALIVFAALAVFSLSPSLGQSQSLYPSQTIKFIVPYSAGGLPDTVARVVARRLQERLAQPVFIENRPGANGGIAAAAQPAAPPAAYKIEEKFTKKSPDGAVTIEQYVNKDTDDWKWQFWVRWQGTFKLLDPAPADHYPADFLFTNDLKWIVRLQKIGSGESTLYLYRLAPDGYVPASKKPLGDLAWAYLKTRPDWRKIRKAPEYHMSAKLVKGLEENYRWLGVDWPANRYILISLSGDADIKGRKPMQTSVVTDWSCRYDLQTGKFDAPALLSNHNAKAIVPASP